MMTKIPSSPVRHDYASCVSWTGNTGQGTKSYQAYERTWEITTPGKPIIQCSNDPLLGGDPKLPNPEDLLLSAVSACHMLWYLHLASEAGVVVIAYEDTPLGIGEVARNGAGRFIEATLRPSISVVHGTNELRADEIHSKIHEYCFIARSLAFPVRIKASYKQVPTPQ